MNTIILNYLLPMISAVLTGVILGYITYKLNSKSKLEYYKKTSKDEQIDKWIDDLKNSVSIFLSESMQYMSISTIENNENEPNRDIIFSKFSKEIHIHVTNITILLSDEKTEKSLYENIVKFNKLIFNSLSNFTMLHVLGKNISEVQQKLSKDKDNPELKAEFKRVYDDVSGLFKMNEKNRNKIHELRAIILDLLKKIIKEKEQERSYL